MDEPWLAGARQALDELLASGRLAPDDRYAVALARAALPATSGGHASFLELALFPMQLREGLSQQRELDEIVGSLGGAIPLEELLADPEAATRQQPGLWDRLQELVIDKLGLRGRLEGELDAVIARSRAALAGPNPPALLSMDAYLELVAAAALADRALKQGLTASDAGRSLEQAASNEELYADLVRRCTEMARGAADSREKLLWMELTLAVRSSPAEVLLAALRNPEIAVAWRDDEEFRLVDDLPAGAYAVAGAYDQWLAWLRARGEARAAERVEAAVRVLAEVRPGE